MLWNPEAKRLSGCIDFGLSHLTGLESGFKKLCEKYPADFVDMVMEEYSNLQSVHMTRRQVQVWAAAEYVAYVLDELKSNPHGYLRPYEDYVRAPLRLPSSPASETAYAMACPAPAHITAAATF